MNNIRKGGKRKTKFFLWKIINRNLTIFNLTGKKSISGNGQFSLFLSSKQLQLSGTLYLFNFEAIKHIRSLYNSKDIVSFQSFTNFQKKKNSSIFVLKTPIKNISIIKKKQ